MSPQAEIVYMIIVWIVILSIILLRGWKKNAVTSSLLTLYVFNICINHLLGAISYALPWNTFSDIEMMLYGFRESTAAFASFGMGAIVFGPFLIRLLSNRFSGSDTKLDDVDASSVARKYVKMGFIFFVITSRQIINIPSINTIVSAGQTFLLVGIALNCWQAWREKNIAKFRRWFLASFVFPFWSVIYSGFLGFGTYMTIIVVIFVGTFVRPKPKTIIVFLVISFLALSLYQTYMRDRNELRAVMWSGAGLSVRIDTLGKSMNNFEWYDPTNAEQLERIQGRMNQNMLVGYAVDYLQRGKVDYAKGETFWDALLALIPRVFWPGKTVYAGSTDIVTRYTGIYFMEGTSVGVGQIMEAYLNFGRAGVVIFFLLVGAFYSLGDFIAGRYMQKGDFPKFAMWFVPLLSFMQAGGSLVECTSSAAAGLIVASLFAKYAKMKKPKIPQSAL